MVNMKFTATADNHKQRLDKFLVEQISDLSRSQIKKLIREGGVSVNGKAPSVHHFLKEGDEVEVTTKEAKPLTPLPAIPILQEGDGYVVINKPAGLAVQATNNSELTLSDWFKEKYPDSLEVGDPLRPGLVHRLDRSTSGVMILATSQKMFDALKHQFREREIKKTYQALVHGHLPEESGRIDSPIGRSHKEDRMAARTDKLSEQDREAVTEYTVTRRYKKYDLIQARPLTGRTHQIRVHLMSLGHPVVGDKKYSIHGQKKVVDLGRNFLHASQLVFKDLSGEEQSISAALPEQLENFLAELK